MKPIDYVKQGLDTIFNRTEKKDHENAVLKMVNAIKSQRSLHRKEIREWKMARMYAFATEKPRRKLLIDLYEDILDDAFIYGRAETRKLRVSNKGFAIINGEGEIDEDKTKLLRKSWFNQFIKYTVESVYFGYSLMYPTLDRDGFIKKMDLVWRDHVVPETCEILTSPEDQTGARFDEEPYARWMIWVNHEKFLGLLNKAAPLYIFKKHSWQNWDEFEELFGIPIRTAKYAGSDKRVQAEIDGWLKDLGTAAWARFPEGVELDITESKSRDSFNVFNEKRKACNEELATLFDGHFETAKDTGSRAKAGSIIESTQDLITLDDETRVEFVINDLLMPMLRNIGYPFTEDDAFIWNENEESTPKERADIFKIVKDLGYKVKRKQIETELDVELEDGEDDPEPEPQPDPDPKNIKGNFDKPHAPKGRGAAPVDYRVINFNLVNKIGPDEEKLLRQIFDNPNSINWDYKSFKASHGKLLDGLRKGYGKIDQGFGSEDHLTMRYMRSNVHRFGVEKTQKEVFDLNRILKDPEVNSFGKFRNRAVKLFPNYRESWLRTEYDQAFATSQMAARYNEMQADIEDAPFWKLSAIIDDGTTEICRSLDGKVFRKDDADSWRFLPPNHWKCRSDAEDVLEGYDGELSKIEDAIADDPDGWERMQKSGHDINWGDAKQAFSASQSYLKGLALPGIDVGDFSHKTFGLPKTANIANKSVVSEVKTAFKDLDQDGGIGSIKDVNGLPVFVDEQTFEGMDAMVQNNLKATLGQADEIYWSELGSELYYRYFKHFTEGSMMVDVKFTKELPAFISAASLNLEADAKRKGLLIHSKD